MNYRWNSITSSEGMNPEEMLQHLLCQRTGIVLLNGYSWCGKTTLLKKLKKVSQRSSYLFSYENVTDEIVRALRKHENCYAKLRDLDENNSIIGIEDIDYLREKTSTQEYLSEMIRLAAEKHLVILTGNNAQQQTPILFQRCNPSVFVAEKETVEK